MIMTRYLAPLAFSIARSDRDERVSRRRPATTSRPSGPPWEVKKTAKMSLLGSMACPALRRAVASEGNRGAPAALIVEANQQLSVCLEPSPQDLPGLCRFAGKDAFGAKEPKEIM